MSTGIVGCLTEEKQIFCTDCRSRAEVGARPSQVFDGEVSRVRVATSGRVDPCTDCGRQVKYQAVTAPN